MELITITNNIFSKKIEKYKLLACSKYFENIFTHDPDITEVSFKDFTVESLSAFYELLMYGNKPYDENVFVHFEECYKLLDYLSADKIIKNLFHYYIFMNYRMEQHFFTFIKFIDLYDHFVGDVNGERYLKIISASIYEMAAYVKDQPFIVDILPERVKNMILKHVIEYYGDDE